MLAFLFRDKVSEVSHDCDISSSMAAEPGKLFADRSP